MATSQVIMATVAAINWSSIGNEMSIQNGNIISQPGWKVERDAKDPSCLNFQLRMSEEANRPTGRKPSKSGGRVFAGTRVRPTQPRLRQRVLTCPIHSGSDYVSWSPTSVNLALALVPMA